MTETFYEVLRRQGITRRSFMKFCSLTATSLGLLRWARRATRSVEFARLARLASGSLERSQVCPLFPDGHNVPRLPSRQTEFPRGGLTSSG